ncbi:MAG TPA: SDR family NAD(P)-dependent oxidoreductase [Bacillota bacterium]
MAHTVLITGAGNGLGLALTKRLLELGWQVFAGYHRSAERLQALTPVAPGATGSDLIIFPLDVTKTESIRKAFETVSSATPALDILLNNAGVHLEDKHTPFEELDFTDGHLEKSMAVNAFGPLRVVQQFLPLLEAGEGKQIINISSEAGSIGSCWRKQEFGYCMSKAALNMQTKILHNCLQPRGFRLLAVHPGWMRTEMGGADADIEAEEAAEGIVKLIITRDKGARQDQDLDNGPGDGLYYDYQGKPLQW